MEDSSQLVRNLVLSACDLKQKGNLPSGRVCSTLITFDNKIFLYGGADENNIYGDIYCMELSKIQWEALNVGGFVKPSPRFGHSFNKVQTNLVLFGGFADDNTTNTQTYTHTNTHTNTKQTNPPFLPPNSPKWTKFGQLSNEIFFFRPFSCIWEQIETSGDHPPPRAFHASTVVKGPHTDYLLIHGGCLNSDYTESCNDLYMLDMTSFYWTKINQGEEVPRGRFGHSMVTYDRNGSVYMFGGAEDNGSLFTLDVKTLMMQNVPSTTLTWKKQKIVGTPPLSRSFHSLNINGDRLFLFGGKISSNFSDFYVFEFFKQRWSRPLYDGIINYRAQAAASFMDKLIIFGGANLKTNEKTKGKQQVAIGDTSRLITDKLFFINVLEIKQGTTDDSLKFKLVTVGDSGVGKSCLLTRFVKDVYSDFHVATLGVDFNSVITMIRSKRCTLQLWDTAGQERFGSVTGNYYRNADGFIIVYDASSRPTFEHVDDWLKQIKQYHVCGPDTVLLLLGNKQDMEDKLEVTEEEAMACAERIGAIYVSTSAKYATNVDPAFLTAATKLVENRIRNGNKPPQPPTPSSSTTTVQVTEAPEVTPRQNCGCNAFPRRNNNRTNRAEVSTTETEGIR